MLRYYLDHHVHGAITAGLRRRGIDCITLHDDGTQGLDDEAVLRRGTYLARILVTQDEDFLAIAHRWLMSGEEFSGVIYSEQMGITVGQAVSDLELIAHAMAPDEMKNLVLRIPL
jgi:predicted nuclease of predicted toxin-antitoxin system